MEYIEDTNYHHCDYLMVIYFVVDGEYYNIKIYKSV